MAEQRVPKLTVIDRAQDIEPMLNAISQNEYIAFDTETTGIKESSEIIGLSICADEEEAFYLILAKWDKEQEKLIYLDTKTVVPNILSALSKKQLICHNAIFDCAMVERNFKVSLINQVHTDTMILAHLLDENRRVGLKDLSVSLLGEESKIEQTLMKESILTNGGKTILGQYDLFKADAQLIGKYGAKDAWLTYKLFSEFVPQLFEQGLDKFFYEEESMPLLRGPTYDMNTVGMKVDTKSLLELKKTLEAECLEAKNYIYTEIRPYVIEKYPGTNKKNGFNLSSNMQLSWLLFGQLKLEFSTITKEGKNVCQALGLKIPYFASAKREFIQTILNKTGEIYQDAVKTSGKPIRAKKIKEPWSYIACDKEALEKHSGRFKWIAELLDYNKKMKLLSTYVDGIGERVEYGIIKPSFLQHGTTSGRYSSRNPNFQNLPRNDKRIKACIVARPGKVFIGADYSQLEPRIFAYVSRDKALIQAFNQAEDFYSVIGQRVYDKYDSTPFKEGSPEAFGVKYKKYRDLSKVIALATVYGATAFQLSKTTGKSPEDTQKDIQNYLENFPGVAKMMQDSHRIAKKYGKVVNEFGRPRRIPEAMKIERLYGKLPHEQLPLSARKLLNLATNHRIQSTAASVVNRAAIAFHRKAKVSGLSAKIVCQVHDSLVIECKESEKDLVSVLLQDSMENTIDLKSVKLEAIPKIGVNLSEV
jgi:DNA polymerase I-like protein with 3'-5' exonuclease and polymerase domains